MTSEELVEKVAREIAIETQMDGDAADVIYCRDAARAAIRIALEEAAKVARKQIEADKASGANRMDVLLCVQTGREIESGILALIEQAEGKA